MREAVHDWLGSFSVVPSSIVRKLVQYDAELSSRDIDTFKLVASPYVECNCCGAKYGGKHSLVEVQDTEKTGESIICRACEDNEEDGWTAGEPECGTLYAPKSESDALWILKHSGRISRLGICVYESEDFGALLGFSKSRESLYKAFWRPLYLLRGRKWSRVRY